MFTNGTYISDALGIWTITQLCLDTPITITNVNCHANGTWSKNLQYSGTVMYFLLYLISTALTLLLFLKSLLRYYLFYNI